MYQKLWLQLELSIRVQTSSAVDTMSSEYLNVVPRGTAETFCSANPQCWSRNITAKAENNSANVAVHIFTSLAISLDVSFFKLQKCQNQNQARPFIFLSATYLSMIETLLALILGLSFCSRLDLAECNESTRFATTRAISMRTDWCARPFNGRNKIKVLRLIIIRSSHCEMRFMLG